VLIATTVGSTCLTVNITHSVDVGAQEKAAMWYVMANLGSLISSLVNGLKKTKRVIFGTL